MSQPKAPPAGGMPSMSGMPSPDVSSMMQQLQQQKMAGGAGAATSNSNPLANSTGTQSSPPSGRTPRAVGTIPQEAKYMAEDVAQGLLSLLPDFMQSILGIKPTDTPEDKARKRQMLHRYNEMNADQQRVVQENLQAAQAKQKQEEEEKLQKKQALEQQQASELLMPQGKTRGEGGPGASSKKRATTKIQNDRKKLSSAG